MLHLPYRVPAKYNSAPTENALPTAVSVKDISSATFEPMPGFEGSACADMYGDLLYGLYSIPNALVLGDAGYLFTHENVPLLEQNAGFLRKKKFLRPRFEHIFDDRAHTQTIDELVVLTSSCDSYFWHWMMDSLPKVVLAEACGFRGSYLLPPQSRAPWAVESMQLLGISSDRFEFKDSHPVRARTLYIPTYFCGYNAHFNQSFTHLFRERVRSMVIQDATATKARIFIGRKETAKVRRILNQDTLQAMLADIGFTTVYFEELSLREQIARACTAQSLIGSHGSGLTHALFMDEGSLVVELFPFKRKQSCDCYEAISGLIKHRYHALESVEDREGDIEVSLSALQALLGTSQK